MILAWLVPLLIYSIPQNSVCILKSREKLTTRKVSRDKLKNVKNRIIGRKRARKVRTRWSKRDGEFEGKSKKRPSTSFSYQRRSLSL